MNNQNKSLLTNSLNEFCKTSVRQGLCGADECEDCPIHASINKIEQTDLGGTDAESCDNNYESLVVLYFDGQDYDNVYEVLVKKLGFDQDCFVTDDCIVIHREDVDQVKSALPDVHFQEKE